MKHQKIIIIGSGFRALIAAHFCLKKSKDVSIISKSKDIAGVMSPLEWQGAKFDKGYQFLDGLNIETKGDLEEFIGKDILYDFGYGASTITNKKVYPDHAIPYWPHKGTFFALNSLIQYFYFNFKKKEKKIISSYEDLIDTLPNNIQEVLSKACLRNFSISAKELSYLVTNFSPFLNYRQTILPDYFSNILKKYKFFDDRIASRRKSLNLDCISLYPKGKNMGVVAEIMLKNLKNLGLKTYCLEQLRINYDEKLVISSNTEKFFPDKIYLTTELDDSINFFEQKISSIDNNYYVPQIFYYFSTKKMFSNFQYVHGNDLSLLVNRANNMSLYGEKTENNEFVLSAEVPANPDMEIWHNPEKFTNTVWEELKLMKLVEKNQKFSKHQIFNLKKTVCLPKINFVSNGERFNDFLSKEFKGKIGMLGLGEITRNNFIQSVKKKLN